MTPAERLTAWHDELAAECAETEQNLAAERSALAAAETAYSEAKAAWAALEGFVTGALGHWNALQGDYKIVELMSPLYSRLYNARDELLKPPEGARGAARATVRNFEARPADLRSAINQIDAVLMAAQVIQLRPHSETSHRRQPQPIDFDNNSPPAAQP